MIVRTCVVVSLSLVVVGVWGEDKWVWGGGKSKDALKGEHSVARPQSAVPLYQAANKNNNLQSDDPNGQLRYEVFENNGPEFSGRPPLHPPVQYSGRPDPGPPYPQRPVIGNQPRPPPPPFGPPPGPPPPPPGKHDLGVLTGPVPSWERPPPPKNNDPTSFDTCKCVNSFNCKSPGLKFGSCDVGKFYCCYNNPGFGVYNSGPSGAYGSRGEGPAVLAGPNGPVDKLRPDFLRPPGPAYPDEPPYNGPPPPGFGQGPFDPRSARVVKSNDAKN